MLVMKLVWQRWGWGQGGQTAFLPPFPLGFTRAMEGGASFPTLLRLALNHMIYFTPME